MSDEITRERSVWYALSLALMPLLGQDVSATVLASDGSTIARFDGALGCAFEPPGQKDELLVIELGSGILHVRPDQVDELDSWSVLAAGRSYASVGISLLNGLSLLIQEDLGHAFA